MDEELEKLETQLRNLKARPLPDDLVARMEQAMASWSNGAQEQGEAEKVLPFPKKRGWGEWLFSNWEKVAAVMVLGGIMALLWPMPKEQELAVNLREGGVPALANLGEERLSMPTTLVASEVSPGRVRAMDGGLISTGTGVPHKVMVLQKVEEMEFSDEFDDKRRVIIRRPTTRYLIMPLEVN